MATSSRDRGVDGSGSGKMTLADRAGFLIVGRLAGRVVAALAPVVLTRLLSPAEFGSYRQLILLSSIMGHFLIFGLPQAVLYFYPRLAQPRRRALIVQSTTYLTVLGAVSAAALIALRVQIADRFSNPQLVELLPLFAVFAAISVASGHVSNLLVARDTMREAAVFTAVVLCVPTLGAVGGALALGGLKGAVLGVVSGGLIIASWSAVILARFLAAKGTEVGTRTWDSDLLREQLSYGLPLALAGAVGSLERFVDHLIVSSVLAPAAYGIYSIGAIAIPMITLIGGAMVTSLVPVWSRMLHEGRARESIALLRRSARKVAIGSLPLACLFGLMAPDLITTVFAEEYSESTAVFRIFSVLLVVHVFTPDGILRASGKTRVLLKGQVGALAVGICLVTLGIRFAGLPGAALGKVTADVLRKKYYALEIRRTLGKEVGSLLPWGQLCRLAAVAAAAGVPTAGALLLLDSGVTRLVVCTAVYAVTYCALLMGTGTLTGSDRELALRWLSLRFLLDRGRDVAPEDRGGVGNPRAG